MWTTSENWEHCGRVLLGNWASPWGRRDHHTTPPPPVLIVTVTMWGKGQIQEQRQIEKKDKDKEVSHPFQPMRFVFRIKPALDYFLIIPQILLDHRLSCLFSIFLSFAELPILGLVCLFKLCVFIFIEVILYMALYVHHQGLRQKASFDWPRYLTLTKQILSSVCSCPQLKKISLPNLKRS